MLNFRAPLWLLNSDLLYVALANYFCKDDSPYQVKFFGAYAAFSLAFWYGTKSYLEHRLDNIGSIVMLAFMNSPGMERFLTGWQCTTLGHDDRILCRAYLYTLVGCR